MAIPNKRARDWRDGWNVETWWWAFGTMWLAIGCGCGATEDLRVRESFDRGWERIAGYRNRLVEAVNEIAERAPYATQIQAREALQPEIERLDLELAAHRWDHRIRAFDGKPGARAFVARETLEQATLRRLMETGLQPEDYARFVHARDGLDRDAIRETSERTTAQNARKTMRDYYTNARATLIDLFEDAKRRPVFVPLGAIFVARDGRAWRSRWPSVMDAAREIDRLSILIEHLTPRE